MADSRGNESRECREERMLELGRAYAAAVLSGDEVAADMVIRDAIDAGLSTAEVDEEVIAPALWLVGELWQRGEITIADEHIATAISLRVLALQRETRRVTGRRPGHRVMLAAPSGEWHDVGLRMVDNRLQEAGYDTVMLGADIPPQALAAAAERHRADVICLSTTMAGGTDRVLLSIYEVQQQRPDTGFVIGGRAVTSRVPLRPGIEVCRRAADSVEAVDAIVNRAASN